MTTILLPAELEAALALVLRGDQGAAQRIIDHDQARRAELKEVTYRLDVAEPELTACRARATYLEQQLAAVKKERDAFMTGGVTEELLRKHDGYIKVGRGCAIVRADQLAQEQALGQLGRRVLLVHRDGNCGDVEGGEIQELALALGLLVKVRVAEPCGESCVCAEWGEFPQDCLRLADGISQAKEEQP